MKKTVSSVYLNESCKSLSLAAFVFFRALLKQTLFFTLLASPSFLSRAHGAETPFPNKFHSPYGPLVQTHLFQWEKEFKDFSIVGPPDTLRLEKVRLPGHTPQDFLMFLAETIRSHQSQSLSQTRRRLSCEETVSIGEDASTPCGNDALHLAHRLDTLFSEYKRQVVIAYLLVPSNLVNTWAFRSRKNIFPSKVSIPKSLTPMTSLTHIELTPEDHLHIFSTLSAFLTDEYQRASGRDLNIHDPLALKSFFKEERLLGRSQMRLVKTLEAFKTETKTSLDQFLQKTEPLLALYSQKKISIAGVHQALERRKKILSTLFSKPLDFSVLLSLSPAYIKQLGQTATDLPGFVFDVQQGLRQRQAHLQKKKNIFIGSSCLVAIALEAWPLCAVIGGWQLSGDVRSQYDNYQTQSQYYLSRTLNQTPLTAGHNGDLEEAKANLLKTSASSLLIPLGSLKILPTVAKGASSTKIIPAVAKWLRWPLIARGKPIVRQPSLFSPLKCLVGACRTVDKAFDLLLMPGPEKAVRSWFRPLVLLPTYWELMDDPLISFAKTKGVQWVLDHPESPYFDIVDRYSDSLSEDPTMVHKIVSTLYRLENHSLYRHVEEFHKKNPLGLTELVQLMDQTDAFLSKLASSPYLRKTIQRFLSEELDWHQMKMAAQDDSTHMEALETFLEQQIQSPGRYNLGVRIDNLDGEAHEDQQLTIQMKKEGTLQALSKQAGIFLESNLPQWETPLTYESYEALSPTAKTILTEYYGLNSIFHTLFLEVVPVKELRGKSVSSIQRRQLFVSALETLIAIIQADPNRRTANSLRLKALQRLSHIFQNAQETPTLLFDLGGRERLEIDKEVPSVDGFLLIQETLYYSTLLLLNQDSSGDHVPAITTNGQKMEEDLEELMAMVARAAGHEKFQSGLMGMLHFTGEFDPEVFKEDYIKRRLPVPFFDGLIEKVDID